MTTKVRMVVYYSGIGARPNGEHTKKQFMDVMKKTFVSNDVFYQILGSEYDPYVLEEYTFKDWITWSGAEVRVHEM